MSDHLSQSDVVTFLRKAAVMSAAVEFDGKPISSVLLFAVDDDLTMYFATHRDSFKAKALLRNPRIGYSVWQNNDKLVQADGVAEVITDIKEIDETLDKIIAASVNLDDFWPPVLNVADASSYIVFKIHPTWMRVHDLTVKTIKANEPPYTEFHLNYE